MNNQHDNLIRSIPEYLENIEEITKGKNRNYAFRGQGDFTDYISSTAARRLNINPYHISKNQDEIFINYNLILIEKAKNKKYNVEKEEKISDLELLAKLQHYGAATALIDFTYDPLVALYFACKNKIRDKYCGVYAIDLKAENRCQELPKKEMSNELRTILKAPLNYLWFWKPSINNPRTKQQNSLFLFGKPYIEIENKNILYIDSKKRDSILRDLENKYYIDDINLFDDFSGFAQANSLQKLWILNNYNELLICAIEQFNQKNYDEVIYYCNLAEGVKDKSLDIYTQQPNRSYESISGKTKEALLKHSIIQLYALRGFSYFILNQFKEAITDFEKVLQIQPNDKESIDCIKIIKQKLDESNSPKD